MGTRELQARLEFARRRVEAYASLVKGEVVGGSVPNLPSPTGGVGGHSKRHLLQSPTSKQVDGGSAKGCGGGGGGASSGGGSSSSNSHVGGVRGLLHDFKSRLHHGHGEDAAQKEEQVLRNELRRLREMRMEVRRKRLLIERRRREVLQQRGALLEKEVQLRASANFLDEEVDSLSKRCALANDTLEWMMRANAGNDCFHIWYDQEGLVMINGFRVGRPLAGGNLQWSEVNAGLGQAALALLVTASALDFRFTTYSPLPIGSFSKIVRVDGGKSPLNLYSDESFSLFPHRNINHALKAFLFCVREVGEHVSGRDPTLQLPYKVDPEAAEVGGLSTLLSSGSGGDTWSRAMKFLLTDIKWTIVAAARYGK